MSESTELIPFLTGTQVVALTMWAEGRGESLLGLAGVGCAIRNRGRIRKMPMRQVCLQKAQFSCWSPVGGQANYDALIAMARTLPRPKDPMLCQCLWLADGIESGRLLDVTHGADHYLTTTLFQSDQCPAWAKTMTVVCVIDHHTFLRS